MNGIEIQTQGTYSRATAKGIIRLIDHHRGYGHFVVLEHPEGYYSIYGYLGSSLCDVGETVLKGQKIGMISQEKNCLFFAIYQGNRALNPEEWLE